VEARSLRLEVGDEELAARRLAWVPPKPRFSRGYGAIYLKHIRQANDGCDFDFLESEPAGPVAGEPEIHSGRSSAQENPRWQARLRQRDEKTIRQTGMPVE